MCLVFYEAIEELLQMVGFRVHEHPPAHFRLAANTFCKGTMVASIAISRITAMIRLGCFFKIIHSQLLIAA